VEVLEVSKKRFEAEFGDKKKQKQSTNQQAQ